MAPRPTFVVTFFETQRTFLRKPRHAVAYKKLGHGDVPFAVDRDRDVAVVVDEAAVPPTKSNGFRPCDVALERGDDEEVEKVVGIVVEYPLRMMDAIIARHGRPRTRHPHLLRHVAL